MSEPYRRHFFIASGFYKYTGFEFRRHFFQGVVTDIFFFCRRRFGFGMHFIPFHASHRGGTRVQRCERVLGTFRQGSDESLTNPLPTKFWLPDAQTKIPRACVGSAKQKGPTGSKKGHLGYYFGGGTLVTGTLRQWEAKRSHAKQNAPTWETTLGVAHSSLACWCNGTQNGPSCETTFGAGHSSLVCRGTGSEARPRESVCVCAYNNF